MIAFYLYISSVSLETRQQTRKRIYTNGHSGAQQEAHDGCSLCNSRSVSARSAGCVEEQQEKDRGQRGRSGWRGSGSRVGGGGSQLGCGVASSRPQVLAAQLGRSSVSGRAGGESTFSTHSVCAAVSSPCDCLEVIFLQTM